MSGKEIFGYIDAKKYSGAPFISGKYGWKLPLSRIEISRFFFVNVILKIIWFYKFYYYYPYAYNPFFALLIEVLAKKGLITKAIQIKTVQKRFAYNCLFIRDGNTLLRSTGCDINPDVAISKALGEYFERWVSITGDIKKEEVFAKSFSQIKEENITAYYPQKYHRVLPEQQELYKELCLSNDDIIEWVSGVNFLTNKNVLIPKELVLQGDSVTQVGVQKTTNGRAGYFTKDGAIIRAILELVERDSFFVHWLTNIAPQVIRIDSLPDDFKKQVHNLQTFNYKVWILDITTDIKIPSICVVMMTEKYEGKITLSAGAHTTYRAAFEKAINEAWACTDFFSRKGYTISSNLYTPFLTPISKEERTHLWQGGEWLELFNWFITGNVIDFPKEEVAFEDEKTILNKLRISFSVLGEEYTPYIFEYKHPLLKEIGYEVVHAFIPFAFPMYLTEKYATFDSERLTSFAKKHGIINLKINLLPHPFP